VQEPYDDVAATDRPRPFPVPERSWIMAQRWEDVLFHHWRFPADVVRPLVPPVLDLELRDGSAWVSLVPLRLAHVHLRGVPPLPELSGFPELNVRTYVSHAGRPGVWFLSIDAANATCAWIGRSVFHAPYRDADIELSSGPPFRFRCDCGGRARLEVEYGPDGPPLSVSDESLEGFLSERYAMFVLGHHDRPLIGVVQHEPWVLHRAHADIAVNTVLAAAGLPAPDGEPLTYFSPGTSSVLWALERL
jgi:uncharacterized protein YqjF (DUF2071 family)